MTPYEAWGYAASWGSFNTGGDPGACMYGFEEDCRPQNEGHRERVIDHLTNTCRPKVEADPDNYEDDELEQMDEFLEFIKNRPLEDTEQVSVKDSKTFFHPSSMCPVSYGTILRAVKETDNNPFTMKIASKGEATDLIAVVNAGIDGHLEACHGEDDKYEHKSDGKIHCEVTPDSLCVLLCRLSERDHVDTEDDEDDNAHSLCEAILTCLGIDESGNYVGRSD